MCEQLSLCERVKVLANEDTLLRTHCCRHKCFPVYPRAQHLLRIQILCPGHKNVSDFVQKHFVSATNVSQFARARKRHEQQCFRNNVSSFASSFTIGFVLTSDWMKKMRGFSEPIMWRSDVKPICLGHSNENRTIQAGYIGTSQIP